MNNRWPYISWRPSAYAAGSAARRSAGPKPSGSCGTAQAPHACMEPTSRKRLRRATGQEAAVHPTPAKITGAKTSWHQLDPVPPCRLSPVPMAEPAVVRPWGARCGGGTQAGWFPYASARSIYRDIRGVQRMAHVPILPVCWRTEITPMSGASGSLATCTATTEQGVQMPRQSRLTRRYDRRATVWTQVCQVPPLPSSSQVRGPFPLGEGLLRVWPVTRSVTSDVSVVPLRLRRNAVLRFVRHAATGRDT